jgi:hypothetical protein
VADTDTAMLPNMRVQKDRVVVVVPNNGVETNHKQAIRLKGNSVQLFLPLNARRACGCSAWTDEYR